jgi:hypothetical protein
MSRGAFRIERPCRDQLLPSNSICLMEPREVGIVSNAEDKPSRNGKRLSHAANSGSHSLADRGDDLYQSPPEAVHPLLAVEKLPHGIWEPAAGKGAITVVLRDRGHAVISSDLIQYDDFPLHFVQDFLTTTQMPAGTEAIVTNPPYKLAQQFVEHALELCPRVIMLMRLAFLESERRSGILDSGQLARVHVFRDRLPMMHRDGWAGPKASSAVAFAWFVWDRNHRGPTVTNRISWRGGGNAVSKFEQPPSEWERMWSHPFELTNSEKKEEESTMSTGPQRPHLVEPPDPFDPEALRLDQAFTETTGVRKLLRRVPVRRPHSHDFVRVHPDKAYRVPVALVDFRDERDAVYLACPHVAREMPGEFVMSTLYTTITRQGVVLLWPVRLPLADGRYNEWHRSAAEAAELAMTRWVRVKSNLGLGCYEMFEAAGTIPEPEWPEETFGGLLKIAFSDRLIDSLDHPVIRRLRGL